MNTIKVKAKQGTQCPMQKRGKFIHAHSPVDVPHNCFYRRLIADGSLIVVTKEKEPTPIPKKRKKR